MIADNALTIASQVAGVVTTLAATFYVIRLAMEFNVELTDRYRDEVDRLRHEVQRLTIENDALRHRTRAPPPDDNL